MLNIAVSGIYFTNIFQNWLSSLWLLLGSASEADHKHDDSGRIKPPLLLQGWWIQIEWAIPEIRGTPLKKTNKFSVKNLGIPRLKFWP